MAGNSDAGWGTPLRPHAGGSDAFIAKLDSDGMLLWHAFLGGSAGDWYRGMASRSTGGGIIIILRLQRIVMGVTPLALSRAIMTRSSPS